MCYYFKIPFNIPVITTSQFSWFNSVTSDSGLVFSYICTLISSSEVPNHCILLLRHLWTCLLSQHYNLVGSIQLQVFQGWHSLTFYDQPEVLNYFILILRNFSNILCHKTIIFQFLLVKNHLQVLQVWYYHKF